MGLASWVPPPWPCLPCVEAVLGEELRVRARVADADDPPLRGAELLLVALRLLPEGL